jgi:hypothetical protein
MYAGQKAGDATTLSWILLKRNLKGTAGKRRGKRAEVLFTGSCMAVV